MAHHASAQKRMRQGEKCRARNRQNLSQLKTQVKKLRAAIAGGDAGAAKELLPKTVGEIDKAAKSYDKYAESIRSVEEIQRTAGAATVGQKIFAKLSDGSVTTGAAGATISGYVETKFVVGSAAAAGGQKRGRRRPRRRRYSGPIPRFCAENLGFRWPGR